MGASMAEVARAETRRGVQGRSSVTALLWTARGAPRTNLEVGEVSGRGGSRDARRTEVRRGAEQEHADREHGAPDTVRDTAHGGY